VHERKRDGQELGSEEGQLQQALLRRAQRAVDAAVGIVARSQAISLVSTDLRADALTCRCAWCGRYKIGHDRWFKVEPSLEIDFAETTHGVCDRCLAALREAGKSM
jgi:hypothetical protein